VVLGIVACLDLLALPWGEIRSLERTNPGTTAFQRSYQEQERAAGRRGTITKRWRPIGQISENLVAAVIVAEDGTFWSHEGFDWFEVQESLLRNLKEHRAARGASTITQQLIKNLFLSPSKNPLRKYHEFVLTWYAERVLSKQRILELYLNEIEWGKGIYGAEAATLKYFGINASEVNREQSARLAAVIPNPRRFDPTSASRSVERRARIIAERMQARDRVHGRVEDPAPEPQEEDDVVPRDTTQQLP
jgi:monofunctional biosynthetic peptidoglycan transglycosylase